MEHLISSKVLPRRQSPMRDRFGGGGTLVHYFDTSLPGQFDEWIWLDETSAVHPLTTQQSAEHELPHPFAVMDR